MIDVVMPQLGESVAEGTVTKWLVREGDFVAREQLLLEVATDKADTEVPSPAAGRVAKIAVAEGTVVAKHGLLCQIDESAVAPAEKSAPAAAPAPAPVVAAVAAPEPAASPLASPSTRKLAREEGVNLGAVAATGERGRITQDDVRRTVGPAPQAAAPAPAPKPAAAPVLPAPVVPSPLAGLTQMLNMGGYAPPIPGVGYGSYKLPAYSPKPGDQVVPFSRRRRITADHMVYSKATSPHVVTVAEVDLYATSKLRDKHKNELKKEGIPLTFLAFICAAVVKALRKYPGLNARVLDGSYALLKDINLGIAVETERGLIVPNIKQADQLSLRGIAKGIDDVATRARTDKLTADDLSGTTFTISNPGMKGNLFGAAILSQPNVGILRVGEIKKRVVVVSNGEDDVMAIHPVMYAALSYDHRIVDGVLANEFLWTFSDVMNRAELEV